MQDTMLDSTISNSIQLFADKGFELRVIMRLGNPWFVAPDACGCLAISNARDALANIDDDDKLKLTKEELDTVVSNYGIKCSVDSRVQSLNLVSESGLYDLIMQSRKPEAKAFKRWVTHEVLPSIRKTGSYGVSQISRKDQLFLDIIHAESEDARVSALTELAEINKQEVKALTTERDEAIRTKAMIGSRREATAMATASARSRECKRLTAENAELKDAIGRGDNWRTIAMMKDEWIREFGHAPVWQKLKQFSADFPEEMKPVKDVEEKVVLQNGREKINISYRYYREAWAKYREYEESLRADVV